MNITILIMLFLVIGVSEAYHKKLSTYHSSSLIKRFEKVPISTSIPSNYNADSKKKFQLITYFGLGLLGSQVLKSSVVADSGSKSNGPIVVLGSGGKTGKLIIEQLVAQSVLVRPTYRSVDPAKKPTADVMESPIAADVTKKETLAQAIQGASAVIFAASASSKGGNAQQVDDLGVANVAEECIRLKIPKLVVISSGAITKPDSLGYKLTNMFGGIMDAKLKGENKLRDIYAKSEDKSLGYAIIRPGGLVDGKPVGAAGIELNQGDTISGEVCRSDVAQCAVAAALSKVIPNAVTFEMYQADKKGPLQGNFPTVSGYERRGSSYDEMFVGLKPGLISV